MPSDALASMEDPSSLIMIFSSTRLQTITAHAHFRYYQSRVLHALNTWRKTIICLILCLSVFLLVSEVEVFQILSHTSKKSPRPDNLWLPQSHTSLMKAFLLRIVPDCFKKSYHLPHIKGLETYGGFSIQINVITNNSLKVLWENRRKSLDSSSNLTMLLINTVCLSASERDISSNYSITSSPLEISDAVRILNIDFSKAFDMFIFIYLFIQQKRP